MCSGKDLYTAAAKVKERESKLDQQLLLEKHKVSSNFFWQKNLQQREPLLLQQKELMEKHEMQKKIIKLKLEYLQLKLNMRLVLEEMLAAVGK